MQASSDFYIPTNEELGLPRRIGEIPSLVMMQTANIAINLSREAAGRSDESAAHMWTCWMDLV